MVLLHRESDLSGVDSVTLDVLAHKAVELKDRILLIDSQVQRIEDQFTRNEMINNQSNGFSEMFHMMKGMLNSLEHLKRKSAPMESSPSSDIDQQDTDPLELSKMGVISERVVIDVSDAEIRIAGAHELISTLGSDPSSNVQSDRVIETGEDEAVFENLLSEMSSSICQESTTVHQHTALCKLEVPLKHSRLVSFHEGTVIEEISERHTVLMFCTQVVCENVSMTFSSYFYFLWFFTEILSNSKLPGFEKPPPKPPDVFTGELSYYGFLNEIKCETLALKGYKSIVTEQLLIMWDWSEKQPSPTDVTKYFITYQKLIVKPNTRHVDGKSEKLLIYEDVLVRAAAIGNYTKLEGHINVKVSFQGEGVEASIFLVTSRLTRLLFEAEEDHIAVLSNLSLLHWQAFDLVICLKTYKKVTLNFLVKNDSKRGSKDMRITFSEISLALSQMEEDLEAVLGVESCSAEERSTRSVFGGSSFSEKYMERFHHEKVDEARPLLQNSLENPEEYELLFNLRMKPAKDKHQKVNAKRPPKPPRPPNGPSLDAADLKLIRELEGDLRSLLQTLIISLEQFIGGFKGEPSIHSYILLHKWTTLVVPFRGEAYKFFIVAGNMKNRAVPSWYETIVDVLWQHRHIVTRKINTSKVGLLVCWNDDVVDALRGLKLIRRELLKITCYYSTKTTLFNPIRVTSEELQFLFSGSIIQELEVFFSIVCQKGTMTSRNSLLRQIWCQRMVLQVDTTMRMIYISLFFIFSLPRPPELFDLEDKVIFKGEGMLRVMIKSF